MEQARQQTSQETKKDGTKTEYGTTQNHKLLEPETKRGRLETRNGFKAASFCLLKNKLSILLDRLIK